MKIEFKDFELVVEERILISKCSTIAEGRVIQLSGRNGSGKSTLLQSIFNNNYSGDVLIDGQALKQTPKLKSDISFIYQQPIFIENTSIKYHLKIHNINLHQGIQFLHQFDSTLNLKSNVSKLSGGQRQMINIMLGMLKPSKYLIIDEPFNYLSKDNSQKLMTIIKQDQRPCIIVEHLNQLTVDSQLKIEKRVITCQD